MCVRGDSKTPAEAASSYPGYSRRTLFLTWLACDLAASCPDLLSSLVHILGADGNLDTAAAAAAAAAA
jgi:hypothetical protein